MRQGTMYSNINLNRIIFIVKIILDLGLKYFKRETVNNIISLILPKVTAQWSMKEACVEHEDSTW